MYTQVLLNYKEKGLEGEARWKTALRIHAQQVEGTAFGDPRVIKRGQPLFATLKQAGLNLEATQLQLIAAIPRP